MMITCKETEVGVFITSILIYVVLKLLYFTLIGRLHYQEILSSWKIFSSRISQASSLLVVVIVILISAFYTRY